MGKLTSLTPPASLEATHHLDSFTCGRPELDRWLKTRAFFNHTTGAIRTFVITDSRQVKGFYSLAAGSVHRKVAPGKIRRNMPEPIPVLILARLAVAKDLQGYGIGKMLLRDAILKMLHTSEIIGIRAMLVHAVEPDAKSFYLRFGFIPSEIEEPVLMLPLAAARASLCSALQNRP